MATYRPKTLNEINNSYGKTMSSHNAIKVSENAITAATEKAASDSIAQEENPSPSAATVGDLTQDIQKFIRDFSAPAKQEEKPVPRTTQIKPKTVRPQPAHSNDKAAAPAVKAEKKQTPSAEKPEFVMTAEKSELFEEYMRIMSDEDDDSFFSKSRSKKKKKSKKHDDASDITVPDIENTIAEDNAPVSDDEQYESFVAPEYQSDIELPEAEETEADAIIADDTDTIQDEPAPVKENKGKVALQLILIVCLLFTLIGALTTALVNVVFKVNTGEKFADKYYIYTVVKDDSVLNLNKGSLVVAYEGAAVTNEIVAYYNSDLKSFDFAVKRGQTGDNVTLAENEASNGQINIFNTNIRGILKKIYPSVGTVVNPLTEHFKYILAGLLAFALVLILILALAFGRDGRRKKADSDVLIFDDDEEESEPDMHEEE